MAQARINHTVTLLDDGRVLIAGGLCCREQGYPRLASAEIYDPATATFTATGNMITPRANHAAVRLPDGKVLITGGYTLSCRGEGCIAGDGSAELYDPSTGTFQAAGRMVTAQANQAAVRLGSGKVLFAGGNVAQGGVAVGPPAEWYDPATGSFQPLGWTAEFGASATLLPGGKVLVAGGWNTRTARIYDPSTNSLSPAGLLAGYPIGVYRQAATLLGTGRVLITGGADDGDGVNTLANAEVYDPASGSFTSIGGMLTPRQDHSAALLPGGSVLLAGGSANTNAELYDPVSGRFTATGSMAASRFGQIATLLTDGRVLIAGGNLESTSSAELYTPVVRAISAASFAAPLAPGSLASLVGSRLAATTAAADYQSPTTTLGGISLRIGDSAGQTRLAALLHVSPAQINFEVPPETALGEVTLEVVNAPSSVPQVTVAVRPVAPALFAFADGKAAANAMRIEPDGTRTLLPPGAAVALDDRPVYLSLFGTGFRHCSSLENVRCTIGGVNVPVEYAGPGGGVPGLDQVNVRLLSDLKGSRDGRLVLTVDNQPANTVWVDVQ
jgi:uncharacterized protein (TIGR03437 family)